MNYNGNLLIMFSGLKFTLISNVTVVFVKITINVSGLEQDFKFKYAIIWKLIH